MLLKLFQKCFSIVRLKVTHDVCLIPTGFLTQQNKDSASAPQAHATVEASVRPATNHVINCRESSPTVQLFERMRKLDITSMSEDLHQTIFSLVSQILQFSGHCPNLIVLSKCQNCSREPNRSRCGVNDQLAIYQIMVSKTCGRECVITAPLSHLC